MPDDYWITGNRFLSLAEMQINAELFQGWALAAGWSVHAICAMLGNIQSESTINPGIWESLSPYSGGYGLVQWTPYTKYSNWAGAGWENNGYKEMQRIQYEAANNLQWFYNSQIGQAPPYSFSAFLADEETDIETMANYFLWFYEHPANPIQPARGTQALYWYNYLDWEDPPGPGPDPPGPDPPGPGSWPYWILFKFRGRGQIW